MREKYRHQKILLSWVFATVGHDLDYRSAPVAKTHSSYCKNAFAISCISPNFAISIQLFNVVLFSAHKATWMET